MGAGTVACMRCVDESFCVLWWRLAWPRWTILLLARLSTCGVQVFPPGTNSWYEIKIGALQACLLPLVTYVGSRIVPVVADAGC